MGMASETSQAGQASGAVNWATTRRVWPSRRWPSLPLAEIPLPRVCVLVNKTVWCCASPVLGSPFAFKWRGPLSPRSLDQGHHQAQSSAHCDYFGTSSLCISGPTHSVDPTLLLRSLQWSAGQARWRVWARPKPKLPARGQRPECRARAPGSPSPGTLRAWPEFPPTRPVLAAVQDLGFGEIPVGLEEAKMTQGVFLTLDL